MLSLVLFVCVLAFYLWFMYCKINIIEKKNYKKVPEAAFFVTMDTAINPVHKVDILGAFNLANTMLHQMVEKQGF